MLAEILVAAVIAMTPVPAEPPDLEYVGTYTISAYSYEEGGGENYFTAGGYEPVPWYTVAAPDSFEMGTVLYIEDIGEVQVQDRGAFPSDRLDLHIGHGDPEDFGLQEREVYIINGQ